MRRGVGASALLLRAHALPGTAFALVVALLGLVVRLGLNTAQHGTAEWARPFLRGGRHAREYPAAFPLVDHLGVHGFIDRFGTFTGSPDFPVHPA